MITITVKQKHVKMSLTVSFLWEKFLDAALILGRRLVVFLFSDAALNRVNMVTFSLPYVYESVILFCFGDTVYLS